MSIKGKINLIFDLFFIPISIGILIFSPEIYLSLSLIVIYATFKWYFFYLDKTLEAKNQLDIIIHEIKTPLTVIRGYAEILGGNLLPEQKIKSLCSKILSASIEVNSIIDSLVLTEEEIKLKKSYLLPVVQKCIDRVSKERQNIEVKVEKGLGPIGLHEPLMEMAIGNLLKNAIKFSPSNTKIEVSLYQEDRVQILAIKDEGKGITDRKKIFDKGFTTDPKSGSGIGLYLTKKIVKKHGGTIGVQSTDKGSNFILSFK